MTGQPVIGPPPVYKCEPCPPASYANKSPRNNCTALYQGALCANLSGSCPMPPAKYDGKGYTPPGGNITLCTPCAPNTVATKPGSAVCEQCPEGQQPGLRRDHCVACNPGEASNRDETDGLCVSCFALHKGWRGLANHSACAPCEPGHMSYDGIECQLCDRGNFWDPITSSCFLPCPSGSACLAAQTKAENATYCSECNNCLAGFYSDTPGSFSCKPCPPGTAQADPGSTECFPCRRGELQRSQGQVTCKMCPQGYYCPNATVQTKCPEDEYCPEGSYKPSQCNDMYMPSPDGCRPTPKLLAIVAGVVSAGTILLSLLIYRRYRQYSRAKTEAKEYLIAQESSKHPVYSGL
eukprot:UC1_evm1s173